MAPLNPNNTGRFWLGYNDGVNDHELMTRFAVGVALNDVMTGVAALLNALDAAASIYLLTITGARFAVAGSDISLPATWSGEATYGTGALPLVQAPREVAFLGRTANGRRFRQFIYGMSGNTPDTYRVPAAGDNFVDLALDVYALYGPDGIFVAIDGLQPTMYVYADVQYNSYWETQRRG